VLLAPFLPLLLQAVHLEWTAPPSCASAEEVVAQLPGDLDGSASATITESEAGFTLELKIGDSTRSLEGATCDEVVRAAILLLQLGLVKQPEPPPEVAPPPPPPPTPALPAPNPRPWTIGAGAFATLSLGGLPQPLGRFGGALSGTYGPWELDLTLATALHLRFGGGPNPDAAVVLAEPIDAGLLGCRLFELGRLSVGPCLFIGGTWLQVAGENVVSPKVSSAALWSGGPGAHARLRLWGPLELVATALVRIGSRPLVYFEGAAPVFQGGPVSLELSTGIGARF
jgi:hypothetical protein